MHIGRSKGASVVGGMDGSPDARQERHVARRQAVEIAHCARSGDGAQTPAKQPNAVEGVFAKLTKRRLKRGVTRGGRGASTIGSFPPPRPYSTISRLAVVGLCVFRSVADLEAAINRFLDEHNVKSKPFTWTADSDKIIAVSGEGIGARIWDRTADTKFAHDVWALSE